MENKNIELKQEVFRTLLEIKKKQYDRIKVYQRDQLNSINDADLDRSEMLENQTENMMREMQNESSSLDHLKTEIDYLEDYRSFGAREVVGPSTIVKTNSANYVVSVPENVFNAAGEWFHGVSTQSPIYQALLGKAKGDTVTFNGQEIKVLLVV